MNKIRAIDLLNKIANGDEMTRNIKYNNIEYFWCSACKIYERLEDDSKNLYNDLDNLLDEIEIIEEPKKIEKLEEYADVKGDVFCGWCFGERKLKNKLNEIIDYINKGE